MEVLVVLAMTALLLTLGAGAARHYWLLHSLEGGADQVVARLREIQERTVAESHPLVYGAWFKESASGGDWGVLKFNPRDTSTSADDTCSQEGASHDLASGVYVDSATFAAGPDETGICASVAPSASDLVFFFARGSATKGEIVLRQDDLERSRTISVVGVTGRVERR